MTEKNKPRAAVHVCKAAELLELLIQFQYILCDLLETFYQRTLSPFRESCVLKPFYQRLLLVAISADLAKASRFLSPPWDDQNRGLKTKRNWSNQYRPQWGLKELAERNRGGGTHTCAHSNSHSFFQIYISIDIKHILYYLYLKTPKDHKMTDRWQCNLGS